MKNVIKLLLLSIICMATKCADKESEDCHTSIRFSNNSEKSLYVNKDTYYLRDLDPFDIRNSSFFRPEQKNIKCCEENKDALFSASCYEHILDMGKVVFIFIFDAKVVENTPWEVVAKDYLVLKRYDLTLEDLQRLNWKITYPPTEAMKDIKQWPPYSE